MKITKLLLALTTLFAFQPLQGQEIRTGTAVLAAMHDRYANSWYQKLTFTQKSTTYNPDGTNKVETWYEALSLPGKLRIDIGDPTKGDGYLMVDGKLSIFKAGKETATRPSVNMLLVLGFDVYRQSTENTSKVVSAEGYDLNKFHEETWEGEQVYVVGAERGDLKSRQFWIEKKRLLFVRLFEPTRDDPTKFREIRFENYRQLAEGWIAELVEVYAEGKKTFSEQYSDVVSNPKLDPTIFDPNQFNANHWEKP